MSVLEAQFSNRANYSMQVPNEIRYYLYLLKLMRFNHV